MNKTRIFKTISASFLGVFLLFSCQSDIDLSNASNTVLLPGEMTLPLASAELKLLDILKEVEFDSDDFELVTDTLNNEIHISLIDSLEMEYRESFDLTKNVAPINVPFFKSVSAGETLNGYLGGLPGISFVLGSDFDDDTIDSIKINKFVMTAKVTEVTGVDPNKVKIVAGFPSANIKNHVMLLPFKVADIGLNQSIDLEYDNFTIDMLGEKKFPIVSDIYITDNETATATGNITIRVIYELKSIDFDVVYGNIRPALRHSDIETHDFDISLLKGFMFANPKLHVDLTSNVGAYMNLKIDYIKAYQKNNPSAGEVKAKFYDKDKNEFESKEIISAKRPAHPGQTATALSYSLNRDSVNLTDLFRELSNQKMPDILEYSFSIGAADKGGEATPYFFTNGAKMKLKVKAEIPFHFQKGSVLTYSGELVDINVSESLPEEAKIDTLLLVLNIHNGLPARFNFKINGFYDENDQPLSMGGASGEALIDAPPVNIEDGTAIGFKEQILKIGIGKNSYDDLQKLRTIKYTVTVDRKSPDEEIHFTPKDGIKIKAGLYLKADITTDDFNTDENN